MGRTREIACDYQPYISVPPVQKEALYAQACKNDSATIEKWREPWIANVRSNHEKFGPFCSRSIGQLYGQFLHRPVIVAGSGPSLKYNVELLKERGDLPLVSCLHNFHYFEDNGAAPDYYVTLDAGEVTLEEVSEGGVEGKDYWDLTKDRTLLAFIGTHPSTLEKWQGEILFYNAPVPDEAYLAAVKEIEDFNMWVSNGGNVLGAALYITKAIMRSSTTIFVGADFSFGYDRRFHSWGSKYDAKMGHVVPMTDVFGNRVASWPSYANFKAWFDYIALNVPGTYINCSEGGCLGAYANGNLQAIKQMDLSECIDMFGEKTPIREQCLTPENASNYVLF